MRPCEHCHGAGYHLVGCERTRRDSAEARQLALDVSAECPCCNQPANGLHLWRLSAGHDMRMCRQCWRIAWLLADFEERRIQPTHPAEVYEAQPWA